MAASAPFLSQPSQASLTHTPPKRTSIKSLAELPGLTSIPPIYIFPTNANDQPFSDAKESIPTIDFSHLTSNNPDERSKVLQELGDACQDWGFFMVINHGVPESMMQAIIEACRGFFELTEEEKQEFEGKHMLDPISCGTSSNVSVDKVLFWRDFLKVFQHPEFHSPNKPAAFRIQHKSPASSKNNSKRNIGEFGILSNGKYKSVLHRAVVNNKDTRISIAMPHGPALNAVVAPASKLQDHENNPPAYKAMKYKDYLELQQSSKLDGKSCLERIQDRTV
ncbi:Oxoglutarate/iron-dependent dioxygenase - like 10 [Theobroma cacao]|nr:Oxoglutarate/iron-dependent dioxygenase - like 10 [Theobroma cacao]